LGTSNTIPTSAPFRAGRSLPTTQRLVFLAALAILHGIVVNLVPALIPTLREVFDLSGKQQGGLGSCFFGASVLVLIASGPATRKFGARTMGVFCGVLSGAGACLLAAAPTYSVTLAAVALLALGMAPIPTIYAALIGEYFASSSQRLFMWTYALMAASATLATSVIGGLIDWWGDYRTILGALGALIWLGLAAVLSFSWSALVRPSRSEHRPDVCDSGIEEPTGARDGASAWSVFGNAALYLLALMMVCDFLCATSIVTWIASLFEETYGNRRLLGGSALSASSAGVCLGRIAMGFLPPSRVSDRILLAVCYLIGIGCFFAILWFRPPYAASLALMALSGAMFAAQSPAMSSLAVKEFGNLAPVAIPLYEAVGNVAGIAGPWLLGGMLDAGTDLGTALFLPPTAGIVLAAVAVSWEAYDRRMPPRITSAPADAVEVK